MLSCQDEVHTQPQACPRHPEWPPSLAWEVSHGLQYLLPPSPAAVPSLWAAGSDWWSRSHATLHAGKEHGSHLRHGSVNVKSIFLQKSYQRGGVGGQREGRVSHTLPLQRRWEDERQWLRTLESNTFIIPRFRPLLFPPWLPRSPDCAPPPQPRHSAGEVTKVAVKEVEEEEHLYWKSSVDMSSGSGLRVRERRDPGSQRLFRHPSWGLSRDRLTRPGTAPTRPFSPLREGFMGEGKAGGLGFP